MAEDILVRASAQFRPLISGLGRAGQAVKNFHGHLKNLPPPAKRATSSFAEFERGLANNLGLAAVTTAAIAFGKESFQVAAQVESLGLATDSLAARLNTSGDAMVSSIQRASGETVTQVGAMQAANKAMLFGLVENEQQMAQMTQIAVTLGSAMGQSATKSIDDFTTALGRQSPMILDNLGITLKLEEAYRIYADQLGKTVEQLTETEKKQAFVSAALAKGQERMEELGGVTETQAVKVERLGVAWETLKISVGNAISEFEKSNNVIGNTITALDGMSQSIDDLKKFGLIEQELGRPLHAIERQMIRTGEATGELAIAAQRAENKMNRFGAETINLMDPFDRAMAGIEDTTIAVYDQSRALEATTLRWMGLAEAMGSMPNVINDMAGVLPSPGAAGLAGVGAASSFVPPASMIRQAPTTAAFQSGQGFGAGIGTGVSVKVDTGDMAQQLKGAADEMARQIQGAVGQVSGLTFGEIMPPEETFRVDEWVRRAQAVANDMNNEWAGALQEEFGGQDFFAPVMEALASGDQGAVTSAIQGIISGDDLLQMMDIAGAVEEAKELLREQNLQAQINQMVSEALMSEGGGEGEQPVLVDIFGSTLPAAIDTTGQSHSQMAETALGELTDMDLALLNIADTTVPELIGAHKNLGDEIGTVLTNVSTQSGQTGTAMKSAFDKAGGAMRAQFPIAQEFVKHLEAIKDAALDASRAVRGIRMGGGGGDSFNDFQDEADARGVSLMQKN